ncbi:A-kinase anchor protein 17A [Blastocystis sp. ATCC 50177/Nand II]|uniref:A-kinase anchor protein 17A n=1 Tax=Blastocystis sp. subtype 1 (strain ATCC 50177 / NandII) TaxID=478820 RepID=A0A196S9H9_BLAHN|nr:A-kinase anchor protein 17A [Blastocystis sp. ATCC 50177/Nand II]
MTETVPFVNGIRLVPVTHVSIVLREMYGVSLSQSVSAWDITEFLRGAFSDSVFDVLIQVDEEITVSFFTTLDSAESVVRSLDGRQTGISSRNVLVSASIVPPLPAQDEWEAAFHCHSEEDFSSLLPGCRPDTVVLSDIPIRWFGLKTPQLEKGSSSLRNLNAFFSHYGAVEEIQLLSSSEIDSFLYVTVGVRFASYAGFCACMTVLRNRLMQKDGVKKALVLRVAFDRSAFFSEEKKKQRAEEEKEAKKEEAARQRRKKEEEEAVRRMTKEVRAQLEALEEVLQSLSAEDREVAKLKEVVEEQRLALDQPTVVSLRESGAVLEKTKRRAKRAGERIAREARERRRREVKAAVKAVSALYAKYETTCEQVSELAWMEERRSRCAAVLREVAELSGEALERDHDALLAKLKGAKQTMEKVLSAQIVMAAMEQSLQEVEAACDAKKTGPLGFVFERAEKAVQTRFLRVNASCNNEQQMRDFNAVLEKMKAGVLQLSVACAAVEEAEASFQTLCERIEQRAKALAQFQNVLFEEGGVLTAPVEAEWRAQRSAVVTAISKDVFAFDAASVQEGLEALRRLERVLQCFDAFTEQVEQYAQLRRRFESACRAVARANKRVARYKEKEAKVQRYLDDVDSAVLKERVEAMEQLKVESLQELCEGLLRGKKLFVTLWREPRFEAEMSGFRAGMQMLLDACAELLGRKEKECDSTMRVLEGKEEAMRDLRESLVERVLYLQNRKACIEEELRLLANRKRLSEEAIRVSSRVAKDDEVHSIVEGEESPPLKRAYSEKRVEFRFNAEKGCFEEYELD